MAHQSLVLGSMPRDIIVMLTGALLGLRVLEYGDMVAGPYSSRLLGDAGADVVKVETPLGDASRQIGPFPDEVQHKEKGGLYLYLNANKRGIVLDIDRQAEMVIFRELVAKSDVVIVNDSANSLDRLGLRWHKLKALNPSLVLTAITPFGLTGPYRDYVGDDIVAVSSGGLAFATPGVPDMAEDPYTEPPLIAKTYTAGFLAGIHAAMATIAAWMRRSLVGQGCEVDVSEQEAVATIMTWEIAHASYLEAKERGPVIFGSQPNAYLPCRDGYVVIVGFLEHHWRGLIDMMGNPEWAQSGVFSDAFERARNWDALCPLILDWTMCHTGQEITLLAQSKGVACFHAHSVGEMMESEQVRSRGFLWDKNQLGMGDLKLPGYPIRMSETPWHLRRRAPQLGEHNAEVLRDWLGYSDQAIASVLYRGDRFTEEG